MHSYFVATAQYCVRKKEVESSGAGGGKEDAGRKPDAEGTSQRTACLALIPQRHFRGRVRPNKRAMA